MNCVRFFFLSRHGREILFFFSTEHSSITSVVFLTIHAALLIARGQRAFLVSVLGVFFFAMVSNLVDTW